MSYPTSAQESPRPDLATFSEFDLEMQKRGYIAHQVMPVFDSAVVAGKFKKRKLGQMLGRKGAKTARAPGSGYQRDTSSFDTATFACQEHGAEELVDRREARIHGVDGDFEAKQEAAAKAYETVLSNQEERVANLLFDATTFSGQITTVIAEWDKNHTADATPIDDVETAVNAVFDRTAIWPNALIINRKVFRSLRNLDNIIDRIQAAGAGSAAKPGDVTAQMLAAVFDLDFVLVADNPHNAADEGQDVDAEMIWSSEYAAVTRVATTNRMHETCFGRIIHYSDDGSLVKGTIEEYYEPQSRSDVIRVRHDVDELLLYPELVQLLDNVTTIA